EPLRVTVEQLDERHPVALRDNFSPNHARTVSPTFWNSFTSEYPAFAIALRNAPKRFTEPSASLDGPKRRVRKSTRTSSTTVSTRRRGKDGCAAAAVQYNPCPGASWAAASGAPSMTASAPHAMDLAMSPLTCTPPSAITCTYRPPVSSR